MNEYIGKTCPFCKTEFKADDEIVVCSSCDMPHHKDCWIENQGCTTFGCLGTIKAADGAPTTVTRSEMQFDESSENNVFCTKCGAKNSTASSFCSKCGNRLVTAQSSEPVSHAYTQANPNNTNPYSYVNSQNTYQPQNNYNTGYGSSANSYYGQSNSLDPDVVALIGTKTEYYIPKFQQLKTQNKKSSWHWPAFFFTPYWFIYRKMYGYGFAVLAAALIIVLIKNPIISFLSLGGNITFGILANNIYMSRLEGLAQQSKTMSEPYKSQFISKNSGTNSLATVLTIIGYAILVGIFSV